MTSGVELLVVLAIVALWLLPAIAIASYASGKGHSYALFFVVALFVSWPIALFVAIVVEDRGVPRRGV